MMRTQKKTGKKITELEEGETLSVTEIIEDKELLLYLGLTNDNNPLFIQHDYAEQTDYGKPVVPIVMLIGIMTSTVSKHLPGPGSNVVNVSVDLITAVYHYATITFDFEVSRLDFKRNIITIIVNARNAENEKVLSAVLMVEPPSENRMNE